VIAMRFPKPHFQALLDHFTPNPLGTHDCPRIHGKDTEGDRATVATSAVRLSEALVLANNFVRDRADIGALDRGPRRHEPHLLALYGYKNNLCPHGIARDPRDLAYFLSEQWGKPTQEWDKPKEKPKDIVDLTGIVAFVNAVDKQDVPCHVALWNKTEAIGRAFFHCEKVLLWKLE
jgi:hypothetical protein